MRTMYKGPDGNWITEEAPQSPEDLYRWLCRYDGLDAVVSDDQAGIYYCGNVNMLQLYRSKGKNAQMFADLSRKLLE